MALRSRLIRLFHTAVSFTAAVAGNFFLQEDNTSKILLEDGSSFLTLE